MNPYVPLLLLFAFAALIGGGFLLLSQGLGTTRKRPEKSLPYECGVNPVGSVRERFTVKFYLVAMIFILFDVEVVFLYPWAVLFREAAAAGNGAFLFIEMMVFLGILAIGLVYLYGRKALNWEQD